MHLRWTLAALVVVALTGCRSAPSGPSYLAFIDKTGKVQIRLKPGQSALSFSEGLAAVSSGSLWGYIFPNGKSVIPPRFGSAAEFSEGLAEATTAAPGDYWARTTTFGYIDKTGEFIIAPRFNWTSPFSEGLAAVCEGPCRNQNLPKARVGYIDRKGKYVLPAFWRSASRFSEGRAWVAETPHVRSGKVLIDRSGHAVPGARFRLVDDFSHGLAATDEGFIDRQGNVVISRRLASGHEGFSDGWACVIDGEKVVFIDTKGKVVLRPEYEEVGSFSEGLAPACMSDCGPSTDTQNWGYIDKTGKFVIPPQFRYRPGPFRDGLALVCFGCMG